MTHKAQCPTGTTLLELLIVLVLMGTVASLVAAGTANEVGPSPLTASPDSLRTAVRNGTAVSLYEQHDDGLILITTAYPSGLLIADTSRADRE